MKIHILYMDGSDSEGEDKRKIYNVSENINKDKYNERSCYPISKLIKLMMYKIFLYIKTVSINKKFA